VKISSDPLKFLKLKQKLDSSDFTILGFIIASFLVFWLFYGVISYFFSISAPLPGLFFILAIHLFVILGSVLLIIRVRRRFLRLSSFLHDEKVSIKEISEIFVIPIHKIKSAILEFKKEGIISGVIDTDKNIYLDFSQDQWNEARGLLIKHKKLSTEDLAKHFEVSKSEAKFILLEIQNQKIVQGYFIEENREFITQDWIYDTFREPLETQGRINLNKTKQRLGLTEEEFRFEFNTFVRVENVNGFFFGKNEFVKFEEHDKDTFLKEMENAGITKLKDHSTKFNLSEDYCKSLINKYLSEGLINGIFSEDKSIFITLDSLREHVISAIRRDESLKLFAKDLGIAHDVLYRTLIRNFNFENLAELTGVTKEVIESILNLLLIEKEE